MKKYKNQFFWYNKKIYIWLNEIKKCFSHENISYVLVKKNMVIIKKKKKKQHCQLKRYKKKS